MHRSLQPTWLLGSTGTPDLIAHALDAQVDDRPVGLISAGWQEWEGPERALPQGFSRPVHDLRLHGRMREVLEADEALAEFTRERQRRLMTLQEDYRQRLRHAVAAALSLPMQRHSDTGPDAEHPDDVHRRDALSDLRTLDQRHLEYVAAEADTTPPRSDALDEAREVVHRELRQCGAVLVAGGHVAVLRNRIRLLDLKGALNDHPLIAWGAGALLCTSRIVLFLDRSPRGRRAPEVLDSGLGRAARAVVVPAARTRLALDDHAEMALHARRFAPGRCLALDGSAWLRYEGGKLAASNTFGLLSNGRTRRLRTSVAAAAAQGDLAA